jgi:hypothetical protein
VHDIFASCALNTYGDQLKIPQSSSTSSTATTIDVPPKWLQSLSTIVANNMATLDTFYTNYLIGDKVIG